jgi:hypothetical protein
VSASARRQARRQATIHAYVGENGGGKSLAAVYDTLPSLAVRWRCKLGHHRHTQDGVTSGFRTVLSTVRFVDPVTGGDHPQWVKLDRWHQLLDAEHADIVLDEVQGVVNSRAHQSLPAPVMNALLQCRRNDLAVRWTTPGYARADSSLREVTQAVTYCKGFLPEPRKVCPDPCKREDDPGHECVGGSLWGAKRVFLWRTYDAFAFDEFTTGKRESLPRLVRQFYRRRADDAQHYYDTLDQVSTIVDVSDAGRCLRCGGTRARPKCACGPAGGEHAPEARAQPPAAPQPASSGEGGTVRTLVRPRAVPELARTGGRSPKSAGPTDCNGGPLTDR